MRPGIVTWNPIEKLALASGLAPVPLMQVFWGLGLGRAAIAGIRLGVFAALIEGTRSAEELAEATGCAQAGLTPLLNALCGFGFLNRRAGRYALSASSRRWLLPGSKGSLIEGMLMLGDLFEGVEPIEEAIRSGRLQNFHHRETRPEAWRHYIRGLGHFARAMGPILARSVKTDRPPVRMLDVAGGHGLYSAAMCRRFPGLASEVLDLPAAAGPGRELVAEEGLSERIAFREGDLRSAAWGEDYDVVFLMNILHNLTPEECELAIGRACAALRPGGTLLVVDSEHDGGEGAISATAGFNELFFFLISGAGAWPEAAIRAWMERAGFAPAKRSRVLMLPGLLVLQARKAQRPAAQESSAV